MFKSMPLSRGGADLPLRRVDATEEFPFLVTKLSPCYDR
jgi:hypothetical protein